MGGQIYLYMKPPYLTLHRGTFSLSSLTDPIQVITVHFISTPLIP